METAKLIQRRAIEGHIEVERIGHAIVDAMAPMFEKVFALSQENARPIPAAEEE